MDHYRNTKEKRRAYIPLTINGVEKLKYDYCAFLIVSVGVDAITAGKLLEKRKLELNGIGFQAQ